MGKKPAKKYSQAARLHDVIRLIEARHGISVEELAEETGVDRRTVHRDLAAIQEAGYPLVSEWEGGRKAYRFLTRFKDVPPVQFTLRELMTLGFLRSQLDLLQGTPFREDMESIFGKVNSVLPPRYAAHLERISQVSLPVLQGVRDYSPQHDILDILREALLHQYRVALRYDAGGKGEEQEYAVDPYTLIFYKGGLYLLGFARNRGALRTFAVERIRAAETVRERFEIPEEYRPETQVESSFGIVEEEAYRVRVRFSPQIAHTIRERLWHSTQQVERCDDGSLLLSFRAGGRLEILSWVLSYGGLAEILEPPELREEARRHALAMVELYAHEGAVR